MLKEVKGQPTGTFKSEQQTVTYIYERAEVTNVIVEYQDEEGNDLVPKEYLSGKIDTSYETQVKQIPGWTLKTIPDNAKGKFEEYEQTVTYIYEVANAAPVIVKYVDEEGNNLATPEYLYGKIGAEYATKPKVFDNWTLKVTPENATGLFNKEVQQVIYEYAQDILEDKKEPDEEEKIEENDTSQSEDNLVFDEMDSSLEDDSKIEIADETNSDSDNLVSTYPKTGDNTKTTKLFKNIGLLLVASIATFIGLKKRSRHKQK